MKQLSKSQEPQNQSPDIRQAKFPKPLEYLPLYQYCRSNSYSHSKIGVSTIIDRRQKIIEIMQPIDKYLLGVYIIQWSYPVSWYVPIVLTMLHNKRGERSVMSTSGWSVKFKA